MNGLSSENMITTATDISVTGAVTQQTPGATEQNSENTFAVLLSDMIQGQASAQLFSAGSRSSSLTGSSLGSLGAMHYGGDDLTSLLSSLSDGEGSQSDMDVMLLYMLMNMNSDSDSGMMMISSLLSAATGDRSYSADLPLSVGTVAHFDARIDDSSAPIPDLGSSGTGGEMMPLNGWVPTNPAITANASFRSSEQLNRIIQQFDVESSARYTPHKYGGDTYCNIFVWDVTSALGCEIPHWVDADTGQPRQYPDIKGAVELGANATYRWLEKHGSENGWIEVSAEEAQMYANKGCPAVTTWKNPGGGAGHVQIVCPSKDGGYDESRGVSVAQAGGHNYEYTYTSSIYGSRSLSQVRYYVHA